IAQPRRQGLHGNRGKAKEFLDFHGRSWEAIQMNRVTCFALFLSVLASGVAAQKQPAGKASPATAYKLIGLKAVGTTRYTDKEILAASGLQIGQNFADGDFKEAVQRLGESGLFSNVVYSFSSSSAGTKLELQLTDIDKSKLVPAHFENFVWFTDDELRASLQTRVPLFKQLLPIAGNLPDRVSEALQALLAENHYPGRVDYQRNADLSTGTLNAIDYRVAELSIRIRSVEFPGASPEQTPLLVAGAHRLIGAEYGRSSLATVAKLNLLPVYLQRGYLKAAFGPSDARVVPQLSSAADAPDVADVLVDTIVPVTPGKAYSTSGVDWKGNSAIITGELAPLV